MLNGKIWGTTKPLLVTPLIEIHKIDILPDSYCSWHHHSQKWNLFYVLEGELDIEVRRRAYALTDMTPLCQGELTTVQPGEVHRFCNRSSDMVSALEVYYLSPLSEDIIRETVGGIGFDDKWEV